MISPLLVYVVDDMREKYMLVLYEKEARVYSRHAKAVVGWKVRTFKKPLMIQILFRLEGRTYAISIPIRGSRKSGEYYYVSFPMHFVYKDLPPRCRCWMREDFYETIMAKMWAEEVFK